MGNDTKDGTLDSLQYMVARIRLVPEIDRHTSIHDTIFP